MPQTVYTMPIGHSSQLYLDIEYEIHGKYLPATRNDPEEFPEIEIRSVTHEGADFSWLLDVDRVDEELVDCCWEHAQRSRMDAEIERAEDIAADRWLDRQLEAAR